MNTGKRIKELRLKKGMTQEELADKTEVSARTIQRIENGEVDPRAYTLQMIAKALDVEYSVLAEQGSFDSQEDLKLKNNTWSGLLHLSGVLPLIVPTLLIWNRKKEKTIELSIHFKAALSFQCCILAISLVSLWIYWKVDVLTPLIGGLLAGGLVSIINAINVLNGKAFINPFMRPADKG